MQQAGGKFQRVNTIFSLGYSEKVPAATGNAVALEFFGPKLTRNVPSLPSLTLFSPWEKPNATTETRKRLKSSAAQKGRGVEEKSQQRQTKSGYMLFCVCFWDNLIGAKSANVSVVICKNVFGR
jgi:hypothetical protein